MRKEKGFTLIELLVVVAIIGLLASVVLASLSTAREKARDAERISDMGQMKTALELYYGSCGQYPNATSGYLDGTESDGCSGTTTLDDFINPPSAPNGSDEYVYAPSGTGNVDYCLGADLEDDNHAQANSGDPACSITVSSGGQADYTVAP